MSPLLPIDKFLHSPLPAFYSRQVLDNDMFLGQTGDRTILQINTSQGVDVGVFSALPQESELLLPPGVALTCTGLLNAGNGLKIISFEDTPLAPILVVRGQLVRCEKMQPLWLSVSSP